MIEVKFCYTKKNGEVKSSIKQFYDPYVAARFIRAINNKDNSFVTSWRTYDRYESDIMMRLGV